MSHDFARYLNIRSAINPVLVPEGGRVAFLSDITGNWQVWSVVTHGEGDLRWPRQLTFLPDKVWELHGAPAAHHLLAVSDVGGNERQQFYRISNYGVDSQKRDVHDVVRLTQNDDAIHIFGAWSGDGQEIVYSSNARNGVHFDLYRMDVRSGESQLLRASQGLRSIAAWSPDGRSVLSVDNVSPNVAELYLLDLKSGEERCLTAGKPPANYWSIVWAMSGVFLFSDQPHDRGALCKLNSETGDLSVIFTADDDPGQGELELLTIALDGRHAGYTANENGYSRLYLLDLRSGQRHMVDELGAGVISTLRFNARSTFLILDFQSPVANPDAWSVRVVDGSCRQLTFSNRAGVDLGAFVMPEAVSYTTFDGRSIPALYFRPQQPPPAGGYPCILYVHGGPTSQLRPDFNISFQYFLQQGYAILAPNVRGSTGYGRRYKTLDDVELRMDSVADLRYALEWLRRRPEIAGNRIAVYGRSYGGFMTLAALTEYPEEFAAGIDVVGIANWVTFLERTGPWRRANREAEYGSLERNRAFLERISPIHKIERIKAPLLVLAGDNDPRVPLYESEQVVERLRAAGGVVEFVHYPDEGHIFSKLPNRIDSFTRMGDFLHRNL
jgi:dipeptidyl aminopeptidase/acylaminoacyl peptidase